MIYHTGRVGLAAGAGYGRLLNSDYFPDPFADYASFALPKSVDDVYDFCEMTYLANGLYREASRRRVSYFVTPLSIEGASDDIEDDWKDLFDEQIDYKTICQDIGMDLEFYGNSYFSVLNDFDRLLTCGSCRQFTITGARAEAEGGFGLRWQDGQHSLKCPRCGHHGPAVARDVEHAAPESIVLRRWSPREIGTIWYPVLDKCGYFWRIPTYLRMKVKSGDMGIILRTPLKVLEAIRKDQNLKFDDDFLLHLRDGNLSGIETRGWGIPRVLANFRQVWYVQVLHRYNEALALDYIIPTRLITPAATDRSGLGGGADLLKNFNAAGFMANVQAMIRGRRRNPTQWNSLPFPVNYQVLGGEARQLAPHELTSAAREGLLDDLGIPVDMYKGSLTVQAAPVALRMFEATNTYIPHNFNKLLKFIAGRVSRILRWDTIEPRLEKVTHADDANRNISKLQLMTQGLLPPSMGFKALDLDYRDVVRQKAEDQRMEAEESARLEEEMNESGVQKQLLQTPPLGQPGAPGSPPPAGPGQPGQPGAPAGPGGVPTAGGMPGPGAVAAYMGQSDPNVPRTPEEEFARATYLAQTLAGMGRGQRASELIQLKKLDPQTHAIVKALIDDIDQKASRQGHDQVMAQRFGKTSAAWAQAVALVKQASAFAGGAGVLERAAARPGPADAKAVWRAEFLRKQARREARTKAAAAAVAPRSLLERLAAGG